MGEIVPFRKRTQHKSAAPARPVVPAPDLPESGLRSRRVRRLLCGLVLAALLLPFLLNLLG
ncbi:hypothetical protein [Chitinilyticum litopenaei]|uniref:hypothetical protein n=1 Tax=Chitinilyticum litopenaei TaxID=1121276 RepID=UPI0003FBF4AC|nr:hypothetical protein [Chitinilyticum litopenaei]